MAGTILKNDPKHPTHPAYKAAHEAAAIAVAKEDEGKKKVAIESGALKNEEKSETKK